MTLMRPFFSLMLLSVVAAGAPGCDGDSVPFRDVGPNWMRHGMLAGFGVHVDVDLSEELDALVDQRVDVVIADSSLSNYMSDEAWEKEMETVKRVTDAAHARGLKVVWYLTSLEVQTVGGRLLASSMYKDHKDWAQVSISGKPNVFFGNQEDWVEPDDESAWMCPLSGYRDYFLDRIKRLVKTGLDGIWVDVPTYMDTAVEWSCACDRHRADFKQKTGLDLGKVKDWNSPAFRRWSLYRHEELREFQKAVAAAAQSVNPEVETILEIFSTDTIDCTETGLDASFMGNNKGISHVWEIDSVSNQDGMLRAWPKDWFSKVILAKYAKGADKGRPTWVFSYGNTEWDAQMVFATAVAAQTNPYETKTPEMATSVGEDFRKRIYSWVEPHKAAIYDSKPAARVAVLYSSHTRDYVDRFYGFGLFTDYDPPIHTGQDPKTNEEYTGPDRQWWANKAAYAAPSAEFIGEYRGMAYALAQLHVPFNIETLQQQDAARLARYDLLIAPNLQAVSDQQAATLRDFVKQGGTLLVTGPRPTWLDEAGAQRPELALSDALGFDSKSIPAGEAEHVNVVGEGRVIYINALLGRRYLRVKSSVALRKLERIVEQSARTVLTTDADPDVHVELYFSEKQAVLHVLNFVGLDRSDDPQPKQQKPRVTFRLPAGTSATAARMSTPDAPGADTTLDVDSSTPGLVTLHVPVENYSLVLVDLQSSAAPQPATLEVKAGWPQQAAALGLSAHVWDPRTLVSRLANVDGGAASGTATDLDAGDHAVHLVAYHDGKQVGAAVRAVKLDAGGTASLSVTPGVDLASGPTQLSARLHDQPFFLNRTASPVNLVVGSAAAVTVPAHEAISVELTTTGQVAFSATPGIKGTITVDPADANLPAPTVEKLSVARGYAGHAVTLEGRGFGALGRVTLGGKPCVVNRWSHLSVAVSLPDDATPGTHDLVLETLGRKSAARPFEVLKNPVVQTPVIAKAFAFVRDNMRSPAGGVYTNYKDVEDPPTATLVYPNGHHQTAEHTGLLLWVCAALLDHQVYEQTFRFIRDNMVSPRRGIVNWAVDKKTGKPMLQENVNSNAPLDDFRVVKALFAGYDMWNDRRYLDLALRIGRGLYETSVTTDYKAYPNGLVAYGYNWKEEAGMGETDADPIPIDYSDLYAIKRLMEHDPRWKSVYDEGVKLLEAAQIAGSGQYWNSLLGTGQFSGDFEYRSTVAGQKIKTIQSLWIAIHLARAGRTASARKALDFYRSFYNKQGRIAEYYNPDGTEPGGTYFAGKLKAGEPRIYGQLVRLALYLGETTFAQRIVKEKLETDQVPSGAVAGHIGLSVDPTGDANAYNSLESLVALAFAQGAPAVAK